MSYTRYILVLVASVIALSNAADVNYRLDSNVVPESYEITIKPYLLPEDGNKRFTFDGQVDIKLRATVKGVRRITLHKDYIDITEAWLNDENGQRVETFTTTQMSYDEVTDILTINLEKQLSTTLSYTLHFVYKGQIRSGMAGFFQVTYNDAENVEKLLGVTQAQRIDARTIFPCFDEPQLKAQFRMHINRPIAYKSFFNTRLISSDEDGEDRMIDHFDETPPMSTYLVAFIVSEYETRGTEDLMIVTRPEYINKTDFAFEVAARALKAYNDYTQLPYAQLGVGILQHATSPKFPHNGMENWGLIIYRDSVLVQEPGYTDGWADKQYTLTIVVHETAHMWFGDSVTFQWWSYFWLNEAFARYYQYFLAHKISPEYQLDQQFVVNQVQLIFGIDAVKGTQPMTSPEESIQSPDEIASKFSSIAYAKGASILRMIHNIMGNTQFDIAIREYLKDNQLENTIPSDLFFVLKKYWPQPHHVDLDQFFHDWTAQVGFPTLNVTVAADRRSINLKQKRFLLSPDDGSDAELTYTIPITYATDTDKDFTNLSPKFYLNKTTNHDFQLDKSFKWIIFNIQQSNYHRVFYDSSTLWNIHDALRANNHSNIPPSNRAQLIDDLFNFARVNDIDYDVVFRFMEYLSQELHYIPWYAAFKGLERVVPRMTTAQLTGFKKFLFDITGKVYQKLGFENSDKDSVLDVYNRNNVIAWLCKYGRPDCAQEAQKIMDKVDAEGVKPSPDIRETIYCAATRFGEKKYYSMLEKLYTKVDLPSERAMLVRAMGCTSYFMDTHYMKVLLGIIPAQYAVDAITPMYSENPENVDAAFYAITMTIEKLAAIVGWSKAADIVSDNADYFTTEEQKASLEQFIEQKGDLFGPSKATLQKAVTNVESNLKFAEQRLGSVMTYLDSRKDSASLNTCATLLLLLAAALHLFVR